MPRGRNTFVSDNAGLRKKNANMPQVQIAVDALAFEILTTAEALFASHDRPGGHRIEIEKHRVDRLISLVGPDPLAVEFGHFQGPRDEIGRRFVKGLHILLRAAFLRPGIDLTNVRIG